MLLLIMSLMAISLLVAGQFWADLMQRERENELIFRGEQYRWAIYEYKQTLGRYPNNVEDLVKKPQYFLRKLYPDPMTKHGEWKFIHNLTECRAVGTLPGAQDALEGIENDFAGFWDDDGEGGSEGPPPKTTGPIMGVVSVSTKSGFRVYNDQSKYKQWTFCADDRSMKNIVAAKLQVAQMMMTGQLPGGKGPVGIGDSKRPGNSGLSGKPGGGPTSIFDK